MFTDSTKKETMDINCISSGSTLLIKVDSVNVIQNQFDKFLEKFVSQEKIYRDAKLPLFIVHSFSKLFKHWLEFPDLRKLMGENVFDEIFREMANVFEPKKSESTNQMSSDCQFDNVLKESNCQFDGVLKESNGTSSSRPSNRKSTSSSSKSKGQSSDRQKSSALSYFKLFCNDCNDNVQMVNGDPCLSYKQHVQSEEHLRCYDLLKVQPLTDPPSINDTKNPNMDCEMSNSKGSSDGDNSENSKAVNYKLPTLYEPFCQPCCKNIGTKELFIGNHLKSESHERQVMLYEESRKILQEHGYYFSIINEDTFECRCHICMIKLIGTSCFIQHCRSLEHQKNLKGIKF